MADKGIHMFSHPRAPRTSGFAAAAGQGWWVVVLPVADSSYVLRVSGVDPNGGLIYDLFTARVQGCTTAQEMATSLMLSVFQGVPMTVTCVGSREGVSFCQETHTDCVRPAFQQQWAGLSAWVDIQGVSRLVSSPHDISSCLSVWGG